ncbi:hypothetical protein T492DRAFT_1032025 [Pavlovales sp. CCMP2436]|nr:hypothetical protein T492DRAFT_1032025 [Pavlovales sp. CCMP2436]
MRMGMDAILARRAGPGALTRRARGAAAGRAEGRAMRSRDEARAGPSSPSTAARTAQASLGIPMESTPRRGRGHPSASWSRSPALGVSHGGMAPLPLEGSLVVCDCGSLEGLDGRARRQHICGDYRAVPCAPRSVADAFPRRVGCGWDRGQP